MTALHIIELAYGALITVGMTIASRCALQAIARDQEG